MTTEEKRILSQIVALYGKEDVTHLILKLPYFDASILDYTPQAKNIWLEVLNHYAEIESNNDIGYHLDEDIKLYALDALVIADCLGFDKSQAEQIAKAFCYFYLTIHYFDDHVEHRDKFNSKFTFSKSVDITTQQGAAPFSFLLSSLKLINDSFNSIDIAQTAIDNVISQTPYFTSERQKNLTPQQVLEMKQYKVSGKALSFVYALLRHFRPKLDVNIQKALTILGALAQITDDIRDQQIDRLLMNANYITACRDRYGTDMHSQQVAEEMSNERIKTQELLLKHMDAKKVNQILSIPYYPFFIDKEHYAKENNS